MQLNGNKNENRKFDDKKNRSKNKIGAHLEPLSDIQDIQNTADLRVFPNPTSGIINILHAGLKGKNIKFQIFDSNLRCMLEQNQIMDNQVHLNLSNLKAGIYTLRITSETQIFHKMVIKY